MVGADKKTIAGVVVGLAAGGVYVTGPLAFPGVSIEVWQGFLWLMVVILATSGLYFALVHMIREERAMPVIRRLRSGRGTGRRDVHVDRDRQVERRRSAGLARRRAPPHRRSSRL